VKLPNPVYNKSIGYVNGTISNRTVTMFNRYLGMVVRNTNGWLQSRDCNQPFTFLKIKTLHKYQMNGFIVCQTQRNVRYLSQNVDRECVWNSIYRVQFNMKQGLRFRLCLIRSNNAKFTYLIGWFRIFQSNKA